MKSLNQHSSRSQHAPIYMSTTGMHRRPFEGRHLVLLYTDSVFIHLYRRYFKYGFIMYRLTVLALSNL